MHPNQSSTLSTYGTQGRVKSSIWVFEGSVKATNKSPALAHKYKQLIKKYTIFLTYKTHCPKLNNMIEEK